MMIPPEKPMRILPPPDWWLQAYALIPSPSEAAGHRCGTHQMLILVAYDITDPKRLQKAARLCEDYGMRVQKSVFECRLEAPVFERFWGEFNEILDPALDCAVAYPVCARCAAEIRDVGRMVHNETVVAYYC
jgi:CRISPR-associated protein Cas2